MLEATIETCVCEYAEKKGVYVRKLVWLGRRGGPDRFFAHGGKILLIEFKKEGKKPDRNQQKEHDKLRKRGIMTAVVDNIEVGNALVDATFFQ